MMLYMYHLLLLCISTMYATRGKYNNSGDDYYYKRTYYTKPSWGRGQRVKLDGSGHFDSTQFLKLVFVPFGMPMEFTCNFSLGFMARYSMDTLLHINMTQRYKNDRQKLVLNSLLKSPYGESKWMKGKVIEKNFQLEMNTSNYLYIVVNVTSGHFLINVNNDSETIYYNPVLRYNRHVDGASVASSRARFDASPLAFQKMIIFFCYGQHNVGMPYLVGCGPKKTDMYSHYYKLCHSPYRDY